MLIPFQSLTFPQKIKFFVSCQELLIKFHPFSEFLITEKNIELFKDRILSFIKGYKGYVFQNENVKILYNLILIKKDQRPILALREKMFRPPDDIYNSIIIDWAIFSNLKFCISVIEQLNNSNIKNILWIKNNKFQFFEKEKLFKYLKKL